MRRISGAALALACMIGQAAAQNTPAETPAPKNGVITPGQDVDPGMKVLPPKVAGRTPVVHPPGTPRSDHHHKTVIVPK